MGSENGDVDRTRTDIRGFSMVLISSPTFSLVRKLQDLQLGRFLNGSSTFSLVLKVKTTF